MMIQSVPHPKKKLTPIQSIKFYCKYVCCANDTLSWKECSCNLCVLYPYRMGKRPQKLPFSHYMKKSTHREEPKEKQLDLQLNSEKEGVLNGN